MASCCLTLVPHECASVCSEHFDFVQRWGVRAQDLSATVFCFFFFSEPSAQVLNLQWPQPDPEDQAQIQGHNSASPSVCFLLESIQRVGPG